MEFCQSRNVGTLKIQGEVMINITLRKKYFNFKQIRDFTFGFVSKYSDGSRISKRWGANP